MTPGRLVLRADADVSIGTGHVMRCLALAQAWSDIGGVPIFVMSRGGDLFGERLREEGFDVVSLKNGPATAADASETASLVRDAAAPWLVIDGYQFDSAYLDQVRARARILVIDDLGQAAPCADILLNQNPAIRHLTGSQNRDVLWLVGPRYALLRREFLGAPFRRELTAIGTNVLVTLGGADPPNMAAKILDALCDGRLQQVQATIVVGAANRHISSLIKTIERSGCAVRLEHNTARMPELMASADVAVAAAGSTVWELAFMGVPSILVIIAENQRELAAWLETQGAMINLGWHAEIEPADVAAALADLLVSVDRRRTMTERCRRLVDGHGSDRVVMHMTGQALRLRPVIQDDCEMLWQWANDPETRRASFEQHAIPWVDHVKWFDKRMRDSASHFYVAVDLNESAVGQARFDVAGDEATISVSVDPRTRGGGYGSTMIRLATARFLRAAHARRINAFVKPSNAPSLRAFQKADFRIFKTTRVDTNDAIHLVLEAPR